MNGQTPQPPNLAAAAAGKFDGAENPPEKNAAGQISAEDKKCGRRRIFFRPVFGGGTKSAPALCNSNTHYYTVKLLIQFIQTGSFIKAGSQYRPGVHLAVTPSNTCNSHKAVSAHH